MIERIYIQGPSGPSVKGDQKRDGTKRYRAIGRADDGAQMYLEIPAPEQTVLEADEAESRATTEANTYKDARRGEYPGIGDQLDALWKGYKALLENPDIPRQPDAVMMLNGIMEIKAKYPKK